MALLAIDPGLNSMGYAYWRRPHKDIVPTDAGLLKAPRRLDLPARAHWLARAMDQRMLLDMSKIEVVSEYPAWHGTSMAWSTGDLQRLVFLVGVLCGEFTFQGCPTFTLCTPAEWKGQLPKDAVIRRLRRKLGRRVTQDYDKDMWDAVGIGLWRLGAF